MHVSDNQKSLQYREFFMADRGKAHRGLGGTSQVDSVVLGRDIDASGEDAHKSYMSHFSDHAGVKSGQKPDRPFRKPCISMCSTTDSVVWGRDIDRSGSDPHNQYLETYKAHAGVPAGEKSERPFRKPVCAMAATLDSVIYGRDIDGSGEGNPLSKIDRAGCAGVPSGDAPERPFRRYGVRNQASNVISTSGEDALGMSPHTACMANFRDHAGVKSGHAVEDGSCFRVRPFRKPGFDHSSIAGDIITGKVIRGDPRGAERAATYAGYAGALSVGRLERPKAQPRGVLCHGPGMAQPPPPSQAASPAPAASTTDSDMKFTPPSRTGGTRPPPASARSSCSSQGTTRMRSSPSAPATGASTARESVRWR